MRNALALALLLLALAGLSTWRSARLEGAEEGSVAQRLLSTGWGLPPARKVRSVGLGAIWIGRQWFTARDGRDGLRAAATTADGELIDYFDYDLTRPGGVRRFGAHCRKRPPGTVLSLALRGSMRCDDAEARELLGKVLGRLGARAAPLELETASWVLVTRRTRDGWQRLGEAFSPRRGVVLTVPATRAGLPGEPARPVELIDDDSPAVVSWVSRLKARGVEDGVRLAWPLPLGTCDGLRFGFGARDEPPTFRLEVELQAHPRFECTLVVAPGDEGGGGEFTLSVDGEPVATRRVEAGDRPVLTDWAVALDRFAGQSVRLELSAVGDGALWGACASPLVLHGAP